MRLIDADALENKMYHEAFENDASYNERNLMAKWDSGLWIRYKLFENAIDDIPTIEPKRGEWITIDTEVVSVPVYWNEEQRQSDERGAGIQEKCKCSACGWITNFVGYKKLGVNKSFNFCPNCGADMREREGE